MSAPDLLITIELVRNEQGEDPFGFRFAPQDYLVRSEDGGFERARIPWDDELLSALNSVQLPGAEAAQVQYLGETLRGFLASAGWALHEEQILAAVAAQRRVLLTFRSAAAELYALPWELLALKSTGQHLGELPGVLLRYEWPETEAAVEPGERTDAGRVLLAWSAAGGAVPAAEHLAALDRACRDGSHPFDPQGQVVANVSPRSLTAALEGARSAGRPFSVLHLLCHGAAAGSTFGLALDPSEPGDDASIVDAGRLRQLLAPHAGSLRLVVLCACESGNSGALGNRLGSIAQALHRAGIAAVVASRFPLSVAGSVQLTETLYAALIAAPESLESALVRCRQRLALAADRLDWASLQLYCHVASDRTQADPSDTRPIVLRPYRGLLSFGPEHGRCFFGREREAAAICEALRGLAEAKRPPLLFVAGASGTGKSSVVLAGAVPRLLDEHPGLCLSVMRPGAAPLEALARVLAAAPGGPAASAPRLLIIDQLEELFTHVTEPRIRESFVQELWRLVRDPAKATWVIATLRVDFIGRCGELRLDDPEHRGARLDTIAYAEAHRLFLGQMPRDALRRAITEPARKVGLALEEGLAERMLDDAGGEPGSLPLLQDALDLLWQRRRGRTLTQAAYDEIGGVGGALRQRADVLVQGLSPTENRTARRLLVRLIDWADDVAKSTRRRVLLEKLRPGAASDADEPERFARVLARLVAARLLLCDGDGAAQTVEVAHEALIRGWPLLLDWARADRKRLVELERFDAWILQWRELGTLLVGAQLGYAEQVARDQADELPDAARALIVASQERARRSAQRRRRLVQLGGVLCLALALLAWRSWHESAAARAALSVARDAARMAAVRGLGDLRARGALLREVETPSPHTLRGWIEAATAVLRNLAYTDWQAETGVSPLAAASAALPVPAALGISGDCSRSVTIRQGEGSPEQGPSAQLWSREGLDATIPLGVHRGAVGLLAVSPSGDRFLVADEGPAARVVRTDAAGAARVLPGHGARVLAGAFSADGRLIATGAADASVLLFREDDSRTELRGHERAILSITFSPGGGHLVSASTDNQLRIWDSSGRSLGQIALAERPAVIGFTRDSRRVFAASERGQVRLWELDGSGERALPEREELREQSETPSSAGGWLGGLPQGWESVRLFSAERIRETPLAAYRGQVAMVKVCSDARRFATVTQQGQLRVWTLGKELRELGVRVVAEAGVRQALIGPRGEPLLTVHDDGAVKSWGPGGSGAPVRLWQQRIPLVTAALSPDGQRLAALDEDRQAWLGSLREGAMVHLPGSFEPRSPPSFSADGRRVLFTGERSASVWSSDGSGPLFSTPEERGPTGLLSASLTPSGQKLLLVLGPARVQVRSTDGQALLREVKLVEARLPGGLAPRACWIPGSTRFAALHATTDVTLWDSAESAGPIRLAIPDLMSHLACSPDGRTVAAAGHGIQAWSSDGSGPARRLAQHQGGVTSLSFGPDGQWLATSSRDGTALIQRLDGTRAPIRLAGQETDLAAVTLSPDGALAVSVGIRGSAWVWSVDPDTHAPLEVLSAQLLRALWETGLPCLDWAARKEYLNEAPGRGRELQTACVALRDCVLRSASAYPRTPSETRFRECRAQLR